MTGRARTVLEVPLEGEVPLWVHPEWGERFTWLVQGTTGAGRPEEPFDLGLNSRDGVGAVLGRWRRLQSALGLAGVVHALQVHGRGLHWHADPHRGLLVQEGYDGHLTAATGLLLTVSVADCVPVFILDRTHRTVALLHAGWRGVAAGIVEDAIRALRSRGAEVEALTLHCGPSICGACYEVGPEVHRAVLDEAAEVSRPAPIDLRAAIASRARRVGVRASEITLSGHCTRCGPGAFFSHRAGSPARQMAVLGRAE